MSLKSDSFGRINFKVKFSWLIILAYY